MLAAVGLSRSFGATLAVSNLTFEVAPGELFGLVGPDGAGKTTALRMLVGLVRPDAGEARVVGQRVATASDFVREAIGYMPQQYSLYGDLSVGENLRFFGELFGLSRAERKAREVRLLEITRLGRFTERRADALSGGMYKKLALACALLHRPQVLVLDEPTNGVDPVSRRELWEMLYELVGEGMSVLLATPYMDEAERCHRVGLLHHGRLLLTGDPGALVRAFPYRAMLVHAADREEAERALTERPEVRAISPCGADLKVLVAPEQLASFMAYVDTVGLSAHPVVPDFEDVFLQVLSEAP